jgi:hypothetical protein
MRKLLRSHRTFKKFFYFYFRSKLIDLTKQILLTNMKKLTLLLLIFNGYVCLIAQKLSLSEEVFIGGAEGYGIIGKYNDRILFFHLDDSKVKIRGLDMNLRKLWDKEVEPDRKNQSKVLEIINSKQDFNVIYQFRKKGHNYLKIHKYDPQVKLLDSATIEDWNRDFTSPTLTVQYSEDKKVALIYEIIDNDKCKAVAVGLDSIRPIWKSEFDLKDWTYDDKFHQIIVTNKGDAYFIGEEDNRNSSIEKHRYTVKHIDDSGKGNIFDVFMKDVNSLHTKFGFNNQNQQLVAAGLYSVKNLYKAIGYFFINIPPQYADAKLSLNTFDDEFVSALQGKKITDNKGLTDLQIQEIVFKRDGGVIAVVEQVREVARQIGNTMTGRYQARLIDYYYDNVFAISLNTDGTTQWKSIFYKKQVSQDDDGRYCSYFLVKTPTALRFLFNDEVERSTTVSEYVLDGKGQTERHTIFNTNGQDVSLRFRDAMQVGAGEVIVPSDDRRRLRLIKIQY